MAGKLTTHVLDTSNGCPGADIALELWSVDPYFGDRTLLKTELTNADGRTDLPLLADNDMKAGVYEIIFAVGKYFAQKSSDPPSVPFLEQVPIRFGIADPDAHYHVPLLVSPWSYSTYRGS